MQVGKGGWALILHGGAKEIKPEEEADNRSGCAEAAEAGAAILRDGGSAIDAVEAAVRVLERLPAFNAGYGSVLNALGEVEMCSALMDGETLDIGGVAAITGVRHPISVARAMLRETPILIAGDGARAFAEEKDAELCPPEEMIAPTQEGDHDTVGAVAIDIHGNVAAGTSTGGLDGAHKGRVGDSPMPGCGFYADNAIGGTVLSGHGEGIARLAAAAQIMGRIGRDGPEPAIAHALSQMERVGGDAGGVAIDKDGRIGWWHNSPHFAVALFTSDTNGPVIRLHKNEEQA